MRSTSSSRSNSRSNSPTNRSLNTSQRGRFRDNSPQRFLPKSAHVEWDRIRSYSHNPIPKKRKGHSMVVYKGKMFMFGGYFGSHAGDLWVYVAESDRWKRLDISGIVPAKRTGHCACMYNSKMIIFGGDSGRNDILNDLWEIDLSVGLSNFQWRRIVSKNDPPKSRYAHSGVVLNHKLYIFGGYSGMYLDECWEFNFQTNRWRQIENIPDQRPDRRCYHSALELTGTDCMIVYGGSNGNYLNDVWIFDSLSLTWSLVSVITPLNEEHSDPYFVKPLVDETLPAARAKHSAVAVDQDKFIIHGGTTGLFRESDSWLFRVLNLNQVGHGQLRGEWIKLEPHINAQIPVPRDSHTISRIGEEIWLFGGSGKGTYFNDLWHLTLDKVLSQLKTEAPSKRFTRQHEQHESRDHSFNRYSQEDTLQEGDEEDLFNQLSEALRFEEEKQRKREEDQQRLLELEEEQERRREEEAIERERMEREIMVNFESQNRGARQPAVHQLNDTADTTKNITTFSINMEQQLEAHKKETEDVRELLSQLKSMKQSEEQSSVNSSFSLALDQSDHIKGASSPIHGTPRRTLSQKDNVSDTANAIYELQQLMKERIRKEDEWRSIMDLKMQKLEECVIKQGEALDAISQVVSKEIESRVAGENRSQQYYQLLYQQLNTQIQTQSHQQQQNAGLYTDLFTSKQRRNQ